MYSILSKYISGRTTINEQGLKSILSCFKPLKPQKDEVLMRAGDSSTKMYFVIKGCVRIFFLQADGSEATRYLAFENNFATGLIGFITNEASQEYIQALENTELLFISRENFYSLLDKVPGWDKFFRGYLEHAYVTNTKRLMSFITMNATERYQLLIAENPNVVLRLSNKMIANYLGISQEALSRVKGKLNKLQYHK